MLKKGVSACVISEAQKFLPKRTSVVVAETVQNGPAPNQYRTSS